MPFYLKTDETDVEYGKMMGHFATTSSYSFPQDGRFPISDICDSRKGTMFAILTAFTKTGGKVVLRGFSGQIAGKHRVPGYVPPCYSITEWKRIVDSYDPRIKQLDGDCTCDDAESREERRNLSRKATQLIKDIHVFYDIDGNTFTLQDLNCGMPTGSGDCAGIKVLNTAMKKGYRISSFAEFYHGPDTAGRKDGTFYPPCTMRCGKIIERMLKLDFLYIDEEIAVINKPSGLLSVPGRGEDKKDCVSERLKKIFPDMIENPFVHRLDMDTSGIIVLARTKESQRKLAMAFENRQVKKEYEALLVGRISQEEGVVDLPMRLDTDNRPYQVIDHEKGKKAVTAFRNLGCTTVDGTLCTRMLFSPHTGRTHQIRVHAACGLGHPIYCDRLYGQPVPGRRLMLHASRLEITHPATGERMVFTSPAPF